ncbi:MAG: CoA transferase [Dehalococcoidia bacterium]
MERALEGIRVLEFARFVAGPYCTTHLADMGAEVIKVERPGGADDRAFYPPSPDGESFSFKALTRNKKGITLNVRSERGKEILNELVKQADVVFHNFPQGTTEARVLDYDLLSQVNPQIIVAALTAWGTDGPYARRVGFDSIVQAESAIMGFTGFPGNPPTKAQVPFIDLGTGLHAALGIVVALFHRQRTGMGQMVDVSLLDTAVSFGIGLGPAAERKILGIERPQVGNYSYQAFGGCFRAKDGWVSLSPASDTLWERFIKAIGRGDLADDPRFETTIGRFENRGLIGSMLEEWLAERTVDEAIRVLEEARVPCGRVKNVLEAMDDPQVKARGMLIYQEYPMLGEVPVSPTPIKFSRTPVRVDSPRPLVGEHNEEVYPRLLGYSLEELSQLKEEGVI